MTSSASSSNVAVMSSLRIKLMFVLLLLLGSCCCRDISGAVFGLESPIGVFIIPQLYSVVDVE